MSHLCHVVVVGSSDTNSDHPHGRESWLCNPAHCKAVLTKAKSVLSEDGADTAQEQVTGLWAGPGKSSE